MKKQTLIVLLFLTSQLFNAQVPNYSFENLNTDGSIKNWGDMILLAVVLDTNGNPTDSLILDNQFYFSTNDAHSGTKALEMRNAYWQNSGETIAGRARLSENDTNYAGFGIPVPITGSPLIFSFYYKFLPSNLDTAYAWLRLADSSANLVGEANIYIHGAHSLYTLASTPVVYTSTTAPAFLEIGFTTIKPLSTPHHGTRFRVDDVNLSTTTTGISPIRIENNDISSFPNPAEKEINLRLKKVVRSEDMFISVIDSGGKKIENISYTLADDLIKINTEELSGGLYFINIIHGGYTYSAKFIK